MSGEAASETAPERAADPEARLQHALDVAYRYLARRDRTVVEMRRHLESKRIGPTTIDAAVAELAEQGYLDDTRYARQFAEDRRSLDAWGPDRIERKLLQAGVAPETIEQVVRGRAVEEELDAAIGLLQRRFARAGLTCDRDRDRALGVLVRKGYGLDLAYDAVRMFEREAA